MAQVSRRLNLTLADQPRAPADRLGALTMRTPAGCVRQVWAPRGCAEWTLREPVRPGGFLAAQVLAASGGKTRQLLQARESLARFLVRSDYRVCYDSLGCPSTCGWQLSRRSSDAGHRSPCEIATPASVSRGLFQL